MHSLRLEKWNTFIRWCELPGEGEPIVCLPGLSFAAVPNFLPLATQPEFRGRRILLVDYIGSGLSGHSETFGFTLEEHADSISAVLDAVDCGPACLLGHSMGGTVAIAIALARPDLVSRLIVCEGNLTPGGGGASRAIAATDEAEFISTGFAERMKAMAESALNGSAFADAICAARTGADPRGVHGNSRALVHLPDGFQEQFAAMKTERHFVYGEKTFPGTTGEVTPDAPDPDLLASHGVGIHVVPGVGHGLMIDDPAAAAKVLAKIV